MASFLQMRHSLGANSLVTAIILAALSQTASNVATQGTEDPVRNGYNSTVTPSGCTMDLNRKDLAPVFTSCRSNLLLPSTARKLKSKRRCWTCQREGLVAIRSLRACRNISLVREMKGS